MAENLQFKLVPVVGGGMSGAVSGSGGTGGGSVNHMEDIAKGLKKLGSGAGSGLSLAIAAGLTATGIAAAVVALAFTADSMWNSFKKWRVEDDNSKARKNAATDKSGEDLASGAIDVDEYEEQVIDAIEAESELNTEFSKSAEVIFEVGDELENLIGTNTRYVQMLKGVWEFISKDTDVRRSNVSALNSQASAYDRLAQAMGKSRSGPTRPSFQDPQKLLDESRAESSDFASMAITTGQPAGTPSIYELVSPTFIVNANG